MLLIQIVTLLVTAVVSAIAGWIVTKNAIDSRVIDVLDSFGLTEIAQEIRDINSVSPYWVLGGLAGAIAGLVLGLFVRLITVWWTGLDLHEHRMTVFHAIYQNSLCGIVAGSIAGFLVCRPAQPRREETPRES